MRNFALLASLALAMIAARPAAAAPPPEWAQDYANSVFRQGVADGRASSAVVTIVQDGKVLLSQGYGFADQPGGRPADPARDHYLIASCTKTFTAAAIALLVEDGRISSLDDPANRYLKRVQLPNWRGQPITLRELLTHSAGFEERGFGFVRQGDRIDPAYIRSAIPGVVRQPGSRIVYANIDPAILGMIVEDVSGEPLATFLDRRLLRPLGMTSTKLNLDSHPRDLVRLWAGSGAKLTYEPVMMNAPFFAPTGSIHTTATDMTNYLEAMLGERPDVLSPRAVARLTSPLMRNDPALPALAMNWFLPTWNGRQVVEHNGGFSGFSAWMVIIPETHTAMFAAWGGGPGRPGAKGLGYGEVRDRFLASALGPARPPVFAAASLDTSGLVGRYWRERRGHTTPEVLLFLKSVATVTRAGPDGLLIDGKGPYRQVAPGVFQYQSGPESDVETVVFRDDQMLTTAGYGRRVSGLADPAVSSKLAIFLIAISASGMLAVAWRRWGAIAAVVAAGAAMAIPAVLMGDLETDVLTGRPWRFTVLFAACLALGLSALALAATSVRAGRSPATPPGLRWAAAGHFGLLALSAAGLCAILVWARALNLPHLG